MRDPWSNHVEPELKIENKVINDPVKYLIYHLSHFETYNSNNWDLQGIEQTLAPLEIWDVVDHRSP